MEETGERLLSETQSGEFFVGLEGSAGTRASCNLPRSFTLTDGSSSRLGARRRS